MTVVAWVVAAAAFIAYAVALQVGPSCANTLGPWTAGAFFPAALWLAYQYDKRGRR